VQLTIDTGLQNFVQARLAGESAASVVLDVATGEIHALASSPSFDPNKFVRGISSADYKALLDDPFRPLANKAVQGAYPPGSTIKMVVAIAALEAGVIGPEETVFCPGHYELGNRRFHCWKRAGHGKVDVHKAIEQSCDVYFYEVAQRTGIDRINAVARRFGLGIEFALPLSGIAHGVMPSREWKLRTYKRDWQIGDTLNAGIGQGYVLSTPLQLAVMAARIASGRAVTPRLVRAVDGVEEPAPEMPDLGFSADALGRIRQAMEAVVNGRRGTARRSRVVIEEMRIAGKTGTSQVRNITAEERRRGVIRNEDLPWNRRDHALFVAYGPVDAPRFATSVVVEHGGGGSKAAAPIARDVLLRALYGTLPPLTAYPAHQRKEVAARFEAMELLSPADLGPGSSKA
ncbi:MAG: penicillin-binding protein 2, partial [Alphaproteobacteria bacterium]